MVGLSHIQELYFVFVFCAFTSKAFFLDCIVWFAPTVRAEFRGEQESFAVWAREAWWWAWCLFCIIHKKERGCLYIIFETLVIKQKLTGILCTSTIGLLCLLRFRASFLFSAKKMLDKRFYSTLAWGTRGLLVFTKHDKQRSIFYSFLI